MSVGDHVGLPERQRVRGQPSALRGQRPFRITQKKQSIAAAAEGALSGVVAAKGQRLRSMPTDLVEGQRAVHVVTTRFQIAAENTRRPQRMARLHLVIGVSVRFGLRQERIAHRESWIKFSAHVVRAPEVPPRAKPALAVAKFLR